MNDAVTTEPSADARPPGGAPAPERVPPPVPWEAGELVFLCFFAVLAFFVLLWPSLVLEVLRQAGFFAWYYAGADPADLDARQRLWGTALAFPFQIATVFGLALPFLGVGPAALGLTRARFGRNLLLGLGSAAVLTPVVLALHKGVVWFYTHRLHGAEDKHPLARLGQMNLTGLEWGLWLFAAVVAAPVVEELLFRGIFQPAAGKTRWDGAVGLVLAVVLTVLARYEQLRDALLLLSAAGWSAVPTALDAFAPLAFILALSLVYWVVAWTSRDNSRPAVYGTAVLFAMVHVSVWPSPVALVVLALCLGWLKERTRGLVAPVVLHSAFNAVSCVLVLLGKG